jgi:hypothetical protein
LLERQELILFPRLRSFGPPQLHCGGFFLLSRPIKANYDRGMADFYQLLGVPIDAPEAQIRRAYRERSKQLHPDSSGSNELMTLLNQAYAVLKDTVSRSVYDAGRAPSVHRTRKRQALPSKRETALPLAAQAFICAELLPLDTVLGVGLDGLEVALDVWEMTPADTARLAAWRQALTQANLNLETVATRLARASWPLALRDTCYHYGQALRLLSDSLWEFESEDATPHSAPFIAAKSGLTEARALIAHARSKLTG